MNPILLFGIRLLEALFIVGWIGSALVLVLSGIEDAQTIFGEDDEGEVH